MRPPRLSTIVTVAAFTLLLALPAQTAEPPFGDAPQAPYGDKVSGDVINYNRAAPQVGTAGRLEGNAVAEAKQLGFRSILDLRGPDEGLEPEQRAAAEVGITYINIPVTERAPTPAQVRAFAEAIENPANLPVLVHCQSSNRSGAMWALYRAYKGIPPEIAIEEGRTNGLTSREPAVRARLGAPAAGR